MKVEQKGHTTTIRNTQGNTAEFYQKLNHEYASFKSQNLIIDLSHDKVMKMYDIKLFNDLIKTHTEGKKSIVFVTNSVNFNKVPKNIIKFHKSVLVKSFIKIILLSWVHRNGT